MPWDDVVTSAGTTGWLGVTSGAGGFITYYTSNTSASTWGGSTNSGFYGFGGPMWDPTQVALLQSDFNDLKYKWERKRAEAKARRLFRRVAGEILYRRFRERGFHEICGASYTRYRLRPGFRVQVMREDESDPDEVAYEMCAHLPYGVPWYDSMAVQHLMLTSSKKTEEQFSNIANKHNPHGPYPIPELTAAA